MILIFILYFLCALTFTIAKSTLAYAQPIFYVGFRMIIAGICLLLFYFFKNKNIAELSLIKRSEWESIAQITIFGIYIAYILDLWSLQYITSIESSIIFNLSPFIAALFSYFWFFEKMTLKKWCGLLLGSSSVLLLMFKQQEISVFFNFEQCAPIAGLIFSVTASAYSWILMRSLIVIKQLSTLLINGLVMLGGGLCALATSAITESWLPCPVFDWYNFLLHTVLIIIVANFLFSNLYGYLLKFYTATFISFSGFLCPLITALLGSVVLGEPLSKQFFTSMIGVFIGLMIFYQEELRQGYGKK